MTVPLFVVGAPRSGTSVLRDLLRLCSGLYLPPAEIQVVPNLIRLSGSRAHIGVFVDLLEISVFSDHMRQRGLWLARDELIEVFGSGAAEEAVPKLLLKLAKKEGISQPIKVWGDKTPEYVFHIDLLMETFPDARILGLIRGPHNTVSSMYRAWGRSILRSSVIWRDAVRALRKAENIYGPDHVRIVKYEDLTSHPAVELTRVAKWLGLEFDPAKLSRYEGDERWGRASGRAGVLPEDASAYRRHLTARQSLKIEQITALEATQEGYQISDGIVPIAPGVISLKLAKIGDGLRIMIKYISDRGLRQGLSYKLKQWRINYVR